MIEDILKQLAEDTAPRNADEFYLGMHLAALLDLMSQNDPDPNVFDALVLGSAKALKYWRVKYVEEINAAGKAELQSDSTDIG